MIAGHNCFEDSLQVRKKIGYLPERVPLYEDMKVFDYLSFVARIKGMPGRDVRQKVDRIMADCGLTSVANKLISAISRGYRQRVGIAQALVNDPEVLILDEPTVGLDPKQIIGIRELIKKLAGKHTVILSTHILSEVSILCDRVIIINKGKVAAVDSLENLSAQSLQKMFLRVQGDLQAIEKELAALDGVQAVEKEQEFAGDDGGFVLTFDDQARGKQNIHSIIENRGWRLVEMRPLEASLEDIFINLVSRDDA